MTRQETVAGGRYEIVLISPRDGIRAPRIIAPWPLLVTSDSKTDRDLAAEAGSMGRFGFLSGSFTIHGSSKPARFSAFRSAAAIFRGAQDRSRKRNPSGIFLVEWGVPPDRIEVATGSRNTIENAQEIRTLFEATPVASAYLVTSAFHMPRALAIFRRAGLPVRPATTDIRAVRPTSWTPLDIFPDVHALATTTLVIKEGLGLLALSVPAFLSTASPTADPTATTPVQPESP